MVLLYRIYLKDFLRNCFIFKLFTDSFHSAISATKKPYFVKEVNFFLV